MPIGSQAAIKWLSKKLAGSADAELSRANIGSNTFPREMNQREFSIDYPKAVGLPSGSRVAFDIDGIPIPANVLIAGRRTVEGGDEGLREAELQDMLSQLSTPVFSATAKELGPGTQGKYIIKADPDEIRRKILLHRDLDPASAQRVLYHEAGHLLDEPYKLNSLLTEGIEKPLRHVFEDLNSGGIAFKRGRGLGPEFFGYRKSDVPRELAANAFSAYLRNPNYIKSISPLLAYRLRKHVVQNPFLSRAIRLNAIVPFAPLMMASMLDRENDSVPIGDEQF